VARSARLSAPAEWLRRHTAEAPAALRARVLEYAGLGDEAAGPASLAAAGWRALEQAECRHGDRGAALDLLAADALITLALLAMAERSPERLGEFAAGLLRDRATRP
jgi:hypothetical protein